jgi:O-antigen/teichoic acid export membrane protein
MSVHGIKRRIFAGVGANALSKVVVSATQLLSIGVLTVHWGLHVYSFWVLISTIPTFLAMGDFGLATAAGVKMTMARARGEENYVIEIFHSACLAVILSSVIFAIASVILSLLAPVQGLGQGSGLSDFSLRLTVLLLLLYGLVIIQGSVIFSGFRCAGKFALGSFWNALVMLLESASMLLVVLLGGGPVLAASALLVGRIVGLAGQTVLLRSKVPWLTLGVGQATKAELRRLVRPALTAMILPLAQAVSLQGTAVVLGIAASPAAVPAFTTARTLSRIGLQACWLFNSALLPEASAAIAREDRRSLALMVLATAGLSSFLLIPLAILFAVFGRPAVALWTHNVVDVPAMLMSFMALSVVGGGFWFPLSNLILAANRHATYTPIYAFLALISLPATYALSARYGAVGAGAAMALLDVVMLVIVLLLVNRVLISFREVVSVAPAAIDEAKRTFARFNLRSLGRR